MGGTTMEKPEALALCDRWLPLWTGNRPEELSAVYSDDVFYRDPAKPDGITGRTALLAYLKRLLAPFPGWVWTAEDVFPIEGGFVLRWKAKIPVGGMTVKEDGMDLVLVRDGLITRNEVYFDRTALLAAMKTHGLK
jgi:ketosteroid isomerase-like protein